MYGVSGLGRSRSVGWKAAIKPDDLDGSQGEAWEATMAVEGARECSRVQQVL